MKINTNALENKVGWLERQYSKATQYCSLKELIANYAKRAMATIS